MCLKHFHSYFNSGLKIKRMSAGKLRKLYGWALITSGEVYIE